MIQYQKILCPIDFSQYSRHALGYAVTIAQRGDRRKLTLMHAIELDNILVADDFTSFFGGQLFSPTHVEKEFSEAFDRFLRENLPPDFKVDHIIEKGRAHKQIVKVAERDDFQLILLSSHGRSGISHFLLGSTTERVIRSAPCPVLTVKEFHGKWDINHVLFPTTGSALCYHVFPYALDVAYRFNAKLTLLHTIFDSGPRFTDRIFPTHHFNLDSLRDDQVEQVTVYAETAADGILHYSRVNSVDLIIMPSKLARGHHLGRTTDAVLVGSECPVLTVNPPRNN
ncbi:MAG: hypothetical protein B6244_13325 [Candidatus Cloacimonetes bacterium 4572_55]|nr:MAG: hypothetical protein B6244_13325 [Candidatus Cloacimonetes bacterium 4572_55]